MKDLILVFIGGGLGSLTRFSIGKWINRQHHFNFPWGTFSVNIIACFVLGFVLGMAEHKRLLSPSIKLFLTIGFCGGFSTFSSFSIESLKLFQQGHYFILLLYILLSVTICMISTFGGILVANRI